MEYLVDGVQGLRAYLKIKKKNTKSGKITLKRARKFILKLKNIKKNTNTLHMDGHFWGLFGW